MNMNDSETVALIGGGHAVGRSHGACPSGPGPSPLEDPIQSWPGQCGQGRGRDTYTSGYEMPFTSRPTNFDSEYFQNLLNYKWKLIEGRGGKNQWEPVSGPDGSLPMAPSAHGKGWEKVGMLTTDIALCTDPDYNEIVKLFAKDEEKFLSMFAHAWYKLTTRDMGPRSRCGNTDAPPGQDWQYPLPAPTLQGPKYSEVKTDIQQLLRRRL